MGKKIAEEFDRFKELLRRLVAVPKKEADDNAETYKEREGEEPEPES
jgi:hypothetical protein